MTDVISRALRQTINEMFLNENAETNNVNAAKRYLRNEKGMSQDKYQQVILGIKQGIPNVRILKMKYTLGIARLFCNRELTDANIIHRLNRIIYFASTKEMAESYDRNLNNLSFQELDKIFTPLIQHQDEEERSKSNSQDGERTVNPNYDIVKITSFEQAAQYEDYTPWCVCSEEDAYDRYVGGTGSIFYFCLAKGYEEIPDDQGSAYPYDEYGLSMIAITVDKNGAYETCTLRWNHEVPKECDAEHMLSVSQIEELLGVDFYKTFLPMSKEDYESQIIERSKSDFGVAYEELEDNSSYYGYDEDEDSGIFDNILVCDPSMGDKDERTICVYKSEDKLYILVDNELEPIIQMAFKDVSLTRAKDYIVVTREDDSENLISVDGTFMFDEWQDGIANYLYAKTPFLLIQKDKKWNVLFENGKWLLKEGAPYITYDEEGNFFNIRDSIHKDSPMTIVTMEGKIGLPFKIAQQRVYNGLWFIMKEGSRIYEIYDRKTLQPFAPWKVTELKGSYGFVYYVVDLEGDNETYYLDKQANLYVKAEAKKMKLIKENPYLKK